MAVASPHLGNIQLIADSCKVSDYISIEGMEVTTSAQYAIYKPLRVL